MEKGEKKEERYLRAASSPVHSNGEFQSFDRHGGWGRNFLADNDFPLELCTFSIGIFRGNECGFGTEWIPSSSDRIVVEISAQGCLLARL